METRMYHPPLSLHTLFSVQEAHRNCATSGSPNHCPNGVAVSEVSDFRSRRYRCNSVVRSVHEIAGTDWELYTCA